VTKDVEDEELEPLECAALAVTVESERDAAPLLSHAQGF
jgi:hypothetical protein